jgi:hypothetical protein
MGDMVAVFPLSVVLSLDYCPGRRRWGAGMKRADLFGPRGNETTQLFNIGPALP